MDTIVAFVRACVRLLTPPPAPPSSTGVALPAYAALARYQATTASLEPRLRLLVSQLAAERSRCRWCIERGRHVWREALLPRELLRALHDYHASPLFSPRERAALSFADAVTRYAEDCGGISAERLVAARAHFTEPELAAITQVVAEMHFFNAATGGLGADAVPPTDRSAWDVSMSRSIRHRL